jgi:hypothetical protein
MYTWLVNGLVCMCKLFRAACPSIRIAHMACIQVRACFSWKMNGCLRSCWWKWLWRRQSFFFFRKCRLDQISFFPSVHLCFGFGEPFFCLSLTRFMLYNLYSCSSTTISWESRKISSSHWKISQSFLCIEFLGELLCRWWMHQSRRGVLDRFEQGAAWY